MNLEQRQAAIVSLVMLVATIALGWISFGEPDPIHILEPADTTAAPEVEQDVIARLWEDPLQAVQADAARHGAVEDKEERKAIKDRHSACALSAAIATRAQDANMIRAQKVSATASLKILVVPIPGTPFPDDRETRLRLRYAVQLALAEGKFLPEDGARLGYFDFDPEHEAGKAGRQEFQVPYEWFAHEETRTSVLVLWLPEEVLRKTPLARLAHLRKTLVPRKEPATRDGDPATANVAATAPANTPAPEKAQAAAAQANLTDFLLIGPRSSDTLKTIANDRIADTPAGLEIMHSLADVFAILSPQATAPDFDLQNALAKNLTVEQGATMTTRERSVPAENLNGGRDALVLKLSELFQPHAGEAPRRAYFHNFICSDDQLMPAIVDELERRGITLHGADHQRVLVLSEVETTFGRSLPEALRREIARAGAARHKGDVAAPSPGHDPVVAYSYLRGLDKHKGHSANASPSARLNPKPPEEAIARSLVPSASMPTGDSQLDYIERWARGMAGRPERGSIKAVAVLGSDLYDKLVLLRALRPIFRDAVFITTDIDARLWHPQFLPFTRNVVVASAYGTEADAGSCDPCAQKNPGRPRVADPLCSGCALRPGLRIPPFRDVYQVAVFRAVTAALAGGLDTRSYVASPPSLYEIGRHGAVPLSGTVSAPPPKKQAPANAAGAETAAARSAEAATATPARDKAPARSPAVQHATVASAVSGGVTHFFHTQRLLGWWVMIITGACGLVYFFRRNYETPVDKKGKGKKSPEPPAVASTPPEEPPAQEAAAQTPAAKNDAEAPPEQPRNRYPFFWPLFLTALAMGLAFLVMWAVASVQGEEPMSLMEGISAWPTQLTRVLIVCGVVYSFYWARGKQMRTIAAVRKAFDLEGPASGARDKVVARTLFARYSAQMQRRSRGWRMLPLIACYALLGLGLLWLIDGGFPPTSHIRGEWSRLADKCFLIVSVISFLLLLFYVLDTVFTTTELFYELSRKVTAWPTDFRAKLAKQYGVEEKPLAGQLDVAFVAQLSEGIGRLILAPIALQLLFLFSRNAYFDNWYWPPVLIGIFIANIALSILAWVVLRGCATKIRTAALENIDAPLEENAWNAAKAKGDPARTVELEAERASLTLLRSQVTDEKRGAYSSVFQDPAILALAVPSGIIGVVIVLFRAFFSGGF